MKTDKEKPVKQIKLTDFRKKWGYSKPKMNKCRNCSCEVSVYFDSCNDCAREMGDYYEQGQTY